MNLEQSLEKRILKVESRNKKVENDKAWETSKTRKVFIALTTYVTLGIYMKYIGISDPWLNAIIPTCGFILSTLSLPLVKNIWEYYR